MTNAEEIWANIQRFFGPKTVYTSPDDAPAVTLGVETDEQLAGRFAVRGHPYLPKGMAFVASWAPPKPQSPGPLWHDDLMDLDANDGYWQP
jgi:hypothetical protein